MKLSKVGRCCVLGALCVASAVAQGATTVQIDTARAKGLAWLVSHQNSEGYWAAPSGLELAAATEGMQAYANAGLKGMPYGRATSWVAVAQASSVDSLSRKIVALQKGGHDVSALTAQLAGWRTAFSLIPGGHLGGGWGAYDHFEASHPDTALALGALRQASYSGYFGALANGNRFNTLCSVISSQQADGSWSYVLPAATLTPALYKVGAITPTVQNMLELVVATNGYSGGIGCGGAPATILSNAANWLIANKKKADGGYGDSVSSAMDTAQVYRALVAVNNTAAAGTALDYLITTQGADGSWGADAFSTALVLASLPATVLADTDRDGVPDVVEAVLITSATVADRGLFGGGTLAAARDLPALPTLTTPLSRNVSTPAPPVPTATYVKAFPGIWEVLTD